MVAGCPLQVDLLKAELFDIFCPYCFPYNVFEGGILSNLNHSHPQAEICFF